MNSAPRLAALRLRLEDRENAALVITRAINVAYLTGFERVFDAEDAHAAVVTHDAARLYTDSRYAEAARHAAVGTDWDVVECRDTVISAVCADLNARGIGWIGIEASVAFSTYTRLASELDVEVECVDGWVEQIRQVKSTEEIARISAAQELTDAGFEHIVGKIACGVTEVQIALELEFFMRNRGSEGVAFEPIVASGPNSALPHARVTDRPVERGDFVKLDFGARVDGYCADMTRTVVVGPASQRQREIYDAVLSANQAGISAVRPGLTGKAIDSAARSVLEDRGFGPQFSHGLGHGVGLEVHELPSVGPRGTAPVLYGSVITIEPGVYVAGYGGVRIEDLVVVDEGDARVLTTSPKDLIEL